MSITTSLIAIHPNHVDELPSARGGKLPAPHSKCDRDDATEAIENRLQSVLQSTGYSQLREVRLQVLGESVHLHGRVDSFFLKQLAQEVVRPHTVGRRIRNHLQVVALPTS